MEPIPFNKKWYSHKFHGPGVRYEVGVGVYNGYVVWVNGPFPAGEWTDAMIVRDSFLGHLCADEVFIADGGYKGVEYCIMPGGWGHVINKQISKIRARHETVNRKFKEYKVIGDRSRHTQVQHGVYFRAVANLVQIPLETTEGNWDMRYDVVL